MTSNIDTTLRREKRKQKSSDKMAACNEMLPIITDLGHTLLSGDINALQECIDNGNDVNEMTCIEGISVCSVAPPLWWAVYMNRTDIVKQLVENGAEVNHSAPSRALVEACKLQGDRSDIVDILINHGADVQIVDRNVRYRGQHLDPLTLACHQRNFEIAKCLINRGKCVETGILLLALYILCERGGRGHTDVMQMVLDRDVDIKKIVKPIKEHTVFMVACLAGNVDGAQFLIEKGADINDGSRKKGETALHLLCKAGLSSAQFSILRMMLDNGANVNQTSLDGFSCLGYACKTGNLKVIELLLAYGANIHHEINGETVAQMIATHNFNGRGPKDPLKILKFLIHKGADIHSKVKEEAVIVAACRRMRKGFMNVIEFLLRNGASLEEKSLKGDSCLLIALRKQKTELVEFLLKEGADVTAEGEMGRSALHTFCEFGMREDLDMIKKLVVGGTDATVKDDYGNTCLMIACRRKWFKTIKYLVDKCGDINTRNNEGQTALLCFCNNYKLQKKQAMCFRETLQCLLQHGADAKVVSADERTALSHLQFQLSEDFIAVLELLVTKGADINAVNGNGDSFFMFACKHRNDILLTYLLQNKADVKVKNKETGKSVLHGVVAEERFVWLVDHGADINAVDKDGNTCIMEKSKLKKFRWVKTLLKYRIDLNLQNEMGETALQVALKISAPFNVLRILIEGTDFSKVNSSGENCLVIACMKQNYSIAKILLSKGADVNSSKLACDSSEEFPKFVTGDSCFMIVCKNEDLEFAAELLEYGANVNMKNCLGQTAFFCVAFWCDSKSEEQKINTLKQMIKCGANLDSPLWDGITYLMEACGSLRFSWLVKFLLKQKIDVKLQDNDGKTALHHFCSSRAYCFGNYVEDSLGIIELFIKCGVDVNAVDRNGVTCLIQALDSKGIDLLEPLVKYGANVNSKDASGISVLHKLCSLPQCVDPGKVIKSVKLVLSKNAEIVKSEEGYTPLIKAAIEKKLSLVDVFVECEIVPAKDKIEVLEFLSCHDIADRRRSFIQTLHSLLASHPELQTNRNAYNLEEDDEFIQDGTDAFYLYRYAIYSNIFGDMHKKTLWACSEMFRGYSIPSSPVLRVNTVNFFLKEICQKRPREDIQEWKFLGDSVAYLAKYPEIPNHEHLLELYSLEVTSLARIAESGENPYLQYSLLTLVRILVKLCQSEPSKQALKETTQKFVQLYNFDPTLFSQGVVSQCDLRAEGPMSCSAEEYFTYFFECGVDPNAQDKWGNTVLHKFVSHYHTQNYLHTLVNEGVFWDLINTLIDQGAHFDAEDMYGKTFYTMRECPPGFDSLEEFKHTSLQCLSCKAIKAHRVPYDCLPRRLQFYIRLHWYKDS